MCADTFETIIRGSFPEGELSPYETLGLPKVYPHFAYPSYLAEHIASNELANREAGRWLEIAGHASTLILEIHQGIEKLLLAPDPHSVISRVPASEFPDETEVPDKPPYEKAVDHVCGGVLGSIEKTTYPLGDKMYLVDLIDCVWADLREPGNSHFESLRLDLNS